MTFTPPNRLYGFELSCFTGKLRAYLRWAGLPFEEVLSDAELYPQVIVPSVGAAVIPLPGTPGAELRQESTEIIDMLDARHTGHSGVPQVYPAGPWAAFLKKCPLRPLELIEVGGLLRNAFQTLQSDVNDAIATDPESHPRGGFLFWVSPVHGLWCRQRKRPPGGGLWSARIRRDQRITASSARLPPL